MNGRFDYVKYDETSINNQKNFKELFEHLDYMIQTNLLNGRAKSLAFTALEEAYMWTGKAIRDEQVQRRGAELQEERNDE